MDNEVQVYIAKYTTPLKAQWVFPQPTEQPSMWGDEMHPPGNIVFFPLAALLVGKNPIAPSGVQY
jgi:hypothetical protein